MKLVNRSVLVLKPTAKMLDWIIRVERIFRYSASSEGKPRSLKTFPLERAIFSFKWHILYQRAFVGTRWTSNLHPTA